MLSKKLGILVVLAALPALAQVGAVSPLTRTTEAWSPRQHAPMRFHGVHPDGSLESENWSGYAVTGTGFKKAIGSWTAPSVDCTKTPNTYSAFWVGIDGFSDETVEQTGTEADCVGDTPSYYAWYEFYPAGSVLITSITVTPGDQFGAEVIYSGTEFTIGIKDFTTGKFYQKTTTVSGAQRTSAEWIAEAPCCTFNGNILPLADFGTADFGPDYTDIKGTDVATDSTTSGDIGKFGADINSITMVSSNGTLEAVPSALSSDGTSFTVTWDSE